MAVDLRNAELAFSIIGALFVARWVLYIVYDVMMAMRKFLWARVRKDNLVKTYGGKWAIVTGCTDGIGKEYARQLARRGMNILLISRNMDKLNDIKQIIKSESPGVETETVQVDFSHGRVVYPRIAIHIQDKDIGILVNNVGVVFIPPKKFINASEDEIWNHVNVNVASVVAMTRLVLAQMVARGSGAIINVASGASSCPMPYIGIYSGTKAFVDFFSESLSWECSGTGVTVQTLRPGAVITNMTNYSKLYKKPSLFAPSTNTYVSSALSTLGYAGRTSGFWTHGLQLFLLDEINPRSLAMPMIGAFMKHQLKKR